MTNLPPSSPPLSPPSASSPPFEHDWLKRWAAHAPQRIALRDVDRGIVQTYGQLNDEALRLGAQLAHHLGITVGDRVAFLGEGSALAFQLQFACFKVGAVFMPLNWRLNVKELRGILEDGTPAVLCYDEAFKSQAQALCKEGLRGFALEGEGAEGHIARSALPEGEPAIEGVTLSPDSLAQILFTSGTTGRPKGAMIPHRQLLYNALNTLQACGLSHRDATLAFLPLFHTGGLNCLAMPLFFVGGQVVVTRRFEPERAIFLMGELGITAVIAVPTMYQMLLEAGLPLSVLLPRLRQLLCGGAPCPRSLLESYWRYGYALRQGFGMTEVGPNCFSLGPSKPGPGEQGVGAPAFFGFVRLVDEGGKEVPEGAVGELEIAGPHVCLGYWNRPEATRDALKGGWFSTGDLARQGPEGYYEIVGRRKDMYISGGENVYPAEIEGVLASHPGVMEACVVGIPHERWGEVGLAVLEARPGVELDPAEIQHFVGEHLARYKVPRMVWIHPSLPRNASGKVLKGELRDTWLAREGPDLGGEDPSAP